MLRPNRARTVLPLALAVLLLVPAPIAGLMSAYKVPTTCARSLNAPAAPMRDVAFLFEDGPGGLQTRAADTTPCDSASTPAYISTDEIDDILVGTADADDWFAFRAFCGETLVASATPQDGLDLELAFHDPGAPFAVRAVADQGGDGEGEFLDLFLASSGEWRVRASIASGMGEYALTVAADTPPLDGGTGVDSSPSSPAPLPAPGCAVGGFSKTDTLDAFSFEAGPSGAEVRVLPGRDASITATLKDPTGTPKTTVSIGQDGRILHADVEGNWTLILQMGGPPPGLPRDSLYGLLACWPTCQTVT